MENSYQSLRVETADGVATLTLLGPGKGNAMGPEFWDELPRAADALTQDSAVRVIIVRGSGDHFSYGLDLPRMLPRMGALLTGTVMADGRRKLMAMIRQMQSGFQKLHESPKPVIAAVHGWCIGGGVNFIAACDIRLCSAEAKFSLREARLAITPDIGGLQWLPGIIGEGYTRELAFTARDFDAAFAEKIRLVNHVYASPEELFARAAEMARQIADNSATAVQGAKAVLNYGIGKAIEDGLQYVAVWNSSQLQSADFAEAIQATMERRKPVFNQ
ncbi:crotonase/enoyl-CoA hydratase family protein [Tellurirhabdus rosea]|uniref:crotonase/enoyl-CoA hydratase family protein n=1 Tax=Tellurirhabdus rosea TaxID=2674997 RepID=UPI0022552FFD|nr:crotonase/enoyl-CoA hydratase family protein [Tellurirhabdus rosea]